MSLFETVKGLSYNNKGLMEQLIKYTDDKKFVRWVLHPTNELDRYWNSYLKNNPEEGDEIRIAREVIQLATFKSERELSQTEIDTMFQNIEKGIGKNKSKTIYIGITKYAAVILLLISIGVGYKVYEKYCNFKNKALSAIESGVGDIQNTQLVLADNNVLKFEQNETYVEQLNENSFVINRTDTVNFKNLNELNKLIVPIGKTAQLKMLDGTMVYMNAGSQLVFPVIFNDIERQAYLSGEAFFEVTHNEQFPFKVVTGNINVEVLGTKFNVAAYPNENEIETFLLEGKVKVTENKSFFKKNEEYLKPLQRAIYVNNGGKIEIKDVNDTDYITWYKGYISFKSVKLSTVINKLERTYGIHIELSNPEVAQKTISGKLKIKNESVETIIQVLANTASLQKVKLGDNTYFLK